MLFFFSACSVNPATLKREFNVIGEEKEIRLGRNASHSVTQSFGGVYDDTDLQKYVNQIGQKIVQVCDRIYLQYQFQVIDSPVLNAFALPGGYIYVTRGLLAELQNEAQLASVLGHEIGHVCARHSAVQLSETLGYQLVTLAALAAGPNAGEVLTVAASLTQTMMLGYSRDREFQADAMGLKYMYKAGYDPKEVSGFLSQLAKKSQGPGGYGVYSSTHPDIFDRIRETRNSAKLMVALDLAHYKIHQKEGGGEAHVTREEVTGYRGNVLEDEYKAHLEGLLYGSRENPRRIHIYTVQESDTIESIADEMFGGDRILAQEIAELNNVEGGAFLQAGTKLKLIY
ncbi:MAG: M48 family metalloprotease [Deltaproteobacteria bacterium]|nr:M48 family metalloprotease [Deltaproteobacteria bacterium]